MSRREEIYRKILLLESIASNMKKQELLYFIEIVCGGVNLEHVTFTWEYSNNPELCHIKTAAFSEENFDFEKVKVSMEGMHTDGGPISTKFVYREIVEGKSATEERELERKSAPVGKVKPFQITMPGTSGSGSGSIGRGRGRGVIPP